MDRAVKPQTEPDPYEPAAEAIIEACGGDPREAVIALLGERDYLAGRVEALERSVSWGFVRAGAALRSGRGSDQSGATPALQELPKRPWQYHHGHKSMAEVFPTNVQSLQYVDEVPAIRDFIKTTRECSVNQPSLQVHPNSNAPIDRDRLGQN